MKILGYIIVILIAIGVAMSLTDSPSSPQQDFSDIGSQTPDSSGSSLGSYYDQLTPFGKKLYESFIPTVSECDDEFTITNVNVEDFKGSIRNVAVALQYDHPEYFWFTGGLVYTIYKSPAEETGKIVIEPTYYDYAEGFFSAESQQEKLQKEIKRVAELAKNHSSDDYERMIFVHDYLIENARYDHDGLDEYYKTNHAPSCEYIFSAYGCLVNGDTVCSGYAKAYQLVMRELGYDCIYVVGDAGEAHGWNCVYIDGEGYYVDITWDDYDMDKEAPAYNYAFITENDLEKTHTIDTEFAPPTCNATDYNYFLYHGYYTDTYDFDTASEILSRQSDKKSMHIKFGSEAEMEKAYKDLVKSGKCREIPGLGDIEYTSKNKHHMTVTFFK